MTPGTLKSWRARLSLGEAGMAAYLGVPVTTYRKWENGTRRPDAAPLRLFEVLQMVEASAPEVHHVLMRVIPAEQERPTKAHKPRAATQVPPSPAAPVVGPDSQPCAAFNGGDCGCVSQGDCKLTAAPPAAWALPDWMKSGA